MSTIFIVVQRDALCESSYTLPVAYTELADAQKRVRREEDPAWPELSYAIREIKLVGPKKTPLLK